MSLTADRLKAVSFGEQKLQMQPPCSLHPGTSLTFDSQSGTGSLHQLEEKQLFEKFWEGTFKAVATPRPESVIVASITSRRRVNDSETNVCPTLKPAEQKEADSRVDTVKRKVCVKRKGRKRHSRRRFRSPSYDDDLSTRPKVKKKKRKSFGKRKRKRSPSHSLSPLRKKKKKRKKSSKKSKRHRYSSKKSKHSSSSSKRKRKHEHKKKKSSRTHSRRRRCYRRSALDSSSCHSAAEDRNHLQKSVVHQVLGQVSGAAEEPSRELQHTDLKWRSSNKSECKKTRSILSTCTVSTASTLRLAHLPLFSCSVIDISAWCTD
ncbi:serine/arginine repetitive matrix protein 4 [Cynoglossus semilaevis]|uniref:serine/arginine repetitive matrix protein 4 n=1 Tax=Cynoglossus semilaevis TaxID=244447 RepID=UPI000D6300E2|nr:serine/arginine repetitive matrix protein 4-like [Cynoglossus semilaevis]